MTSVLPRRVASHSSSVLEANTSSSTEAIHVNEYKSGVQPGADLEILHVVLFEIDEGDACDDVEHGAEIDAHEEPAVLLARLADLHIEAAWICGQLAARTQLDDDGDQRLMDGMPSAPDSGRLLGVRELAERLAVNPRTVRRWREQGRLPRAIEMGGVVRWRQEDIDQWLSTPTSKGNTP